MSKGNQKVRIYSALEVANICGVVNQTAINWIRNGHLKAFTTPGGQYRVYEEDLSDFLNERGMRNSINALHLMSENSNTMSAGSETVLIIDNNRTINDQLKTYLEDVVPDFRVLQAYDGFEAGRQLYQEKPGLVFLNIDLPGINVFDLAKKFKEESTLGNPTVIALVSNETEGFLRASWADAFFPEPLDLDRVRQTVMDMGTRALVTA
ncbi:MAG: helix-turn-helix domain-containing protein [Treponema sp.]|jgi:excisionase family DNA binding protein|nr:helix-turn-helix domain-containing protein [Treponema sp.]